MFEPKKQCLRRSERETRAPAPRKRGALYLSYKNAVSDRGGTGAVLRRMPRRGWGGPILRRGRFRRRQAAEGGFHLSQLNVQRGELPRDAGEEPVPHLAL